MVIATSAFAVTGVLGAAGFAVHVMSKQPDPPTKYVAAARDAQPDRAGRGGRAAVPGPAAGPCETTSSGQLDVENYLVTQTRFGSVKPDGNQSPLDCQAIRKFQDWAGIPTVTGSADEVTADVARRLSAVDLSQCEAKRSGRTVCIDLTNQVLWLVQDGDVAFGPVVTRTGQPGMETHPGKFRIQEKKAKARSNIYNVDTNFWQQYDGEFGIHAAAKSIPMYAPVKGSHGCANLLPGDAETLFERTDVGDAVHIWGRKP